MSRVHLRVSGLLGWSGRLNDERHVLFVWQMSRLLALPQGVVYREGVARYCQMLRVHLGKTFSAGIVSVRASWV